MCAYLTKDGLETLLTKIKNQFVEIGEKNKYSGIVSSTISDNGGVSSIRNPINNYIYKVSGSEIYLEPNRGSKQYYLYNKFTYPEKCNFYFPENSYIKYQEDLFSSSTTTTGGKTYKKLTPNIELDYYVIEVVQYAPNGIVDAYIIEIDCSYSTDNCYVEIEKSSQGTKFINTSWFNAYKNYVSKITYYNNSSYVNLSKNLTTNMVDGVDNLWGSYTKMRIHFNPGLKSFSGMFESCHIKNVSLMSKPSSVVDFSYMFMDSTLESCVDLDPINMPAYSNCKGMFKNCISLQNIYAVSTNQDIVHNDNTKFMLKFNWLGDAIWDSMFEGCINMRYIDLMDWVISPDSKISADFMFKDTHKYSFAPESFGYGINTIVLPPANNNKPYIYSSLKMFEGCGCLGYVYTKFVKLKLLKHYDFTVYDPIRGHLLDPNSSDNLEVPQYLLPNELNREAKDFLNNIENAYGELTEEEIIWPGVVFTSEAEKLDMMGSILNIEYPSSTYWGTNLLGSTNSLTFDKNSMKFKFESGKVYLDNIVISRAGGGDYRSNVTSCLLNHYAGVNTELKNIGHTMMIAPYYSRENKYLQYRDDLVRNDRPQQILADEYAYFRYMYLWNRPDVTMSMLSGSDGEAWCKRWIPVYKDTYNIVV